jgi:N-acetylglucosamine kinase-like BadF-type ATPase
MAQNIRTTGRLCVQHMVIEIVIGIDGGATKTECSIINIRTREVLSVSTSGSSNKNSVGNEVAKNHLTQSMNEAMSIVRSKFANETFHLVGIGLGMSGVDRPHDKQLVKSWVPDILANLTANHGQVLTVSNNIIVDVHNDAISALASGTLGNLKDALVVISGTGMIVTGSSDGVQFVRTGGWGPLLGDRGSGYNIGSEILRACVNYQDGLLEEETVLVDLVKKHAQIEDMNQLIDFVYKDTAWNRIADLARLVFDGYSMNDNVSRKIVENAADDLENYIRIAVKKLAWPSDKVFTIVYTGSILTHGNSVVAQLLSKNLKQRYPNVNITFPKVSASVGSALPLINLYQET